jgi:regulator of nucleoside diphosphate kinase
MTVTRIITHTDRRRLGTMLQSAHVCARELPGHLHALEAELEQSRGVAPEEVPDDIVTMNSNVTILDLSTNEVETYTLVYPDLADIATGRISVLAPVATAVLGCRVGDVVTVRVPSGRRRIKVKDIAFQPERAGEYHL